MTLLHAAACLPNNNPTGCWNWKMDFQLEILWLATMHSICVVSIYLQTPFAGKEWRNSKALLFPTPATILLGTGEQKHVLLTMMLITLSIKIASWSKWPLGSWCLNGASFAMVVSISRYDFLAWSRLHTTFIIELEGGGEGLTVRHLQWLEDVEMTRWHSFLSVRCWCQLSTIPGNSIIHEILFDHNHECNAGTCAPKIHLRLEQ